MHGAPAEFPGRDLGGTVRSGLGGEAILSVDGIEVDRKRIERTVAGRFGIDTFGVGVDTRAPPPPAFGRPGVPRPPGELQGRRLRRPCSTGIVVAQ